MFAKEVNTLTAARGVMAVTVIAALVMLVSPVLARAELMLEPGSFKVTTSSNQAGAHADVTTSFRFVQNAEGRTEGDVRTAVVNLPTGFAGTPATVPTCAQYQLQRSSLFEAGCPLDTQVGQITLLLDVDGETELTEATVPVFDMVAGPHEAADFGFIINGFIAGNIAITVRAGDNGVRATATDISGQVEVVSSSLTLWGVPESESHFAQRGAFCYSGFCLNEGEKNSKGEEGHRAGANPVPFLDNPTRCTSEPLEATLGVNSWRDEKFEAEDKFAIDATTTVGPFTGCEHLGFDPLLSVQPTLTQAGEPTGLNVGVAVPQNEAPEGLETADLRTAVVTLPSGMVLSPSAANGLEACQATGPEGINMTGSESEEHDFYGHTRAAKGKCPNASELAAVKVFTPAFASPLEGHVYLAKPGCGGTGQAECTAADAEDGTLFSIYLEAEGPGVIIKLKGRVSVNATTGQVTTTFAEDPQLPFSSLQIEFFGGPRAPLANPSACGEARTTGLFTPYSSEIAVEPFSGYTVTGCQGPRFAPAFTAGTDSNVAGGYSPLSVTFSREDSDEQLGRVTMRTPPGLLGDIAKVPLCGEPEAGRGTCPSASQIGETTVAAGPGPDPLYVTGGKVYLTGPYEGGSFGLSVVVSAVTGPFNLGTVVVRAAIEINPVTAALTVVSEPLPTILDGIPIQVKLVDVNINRPEFVFSPTSCEPTSINGTLSSTEGMSAQVSSRYQTADCAALAFKPTFAATTTAHNTRTEGASLTTTVTYPNTPQGTEANIAKVKVSLPAKLPARLTTLQKACPEATFAANPANCPAASKIGVATTDTLVLPGSLSGPAYFVSHGGAQYPELVIELTGDNVTVDLHGETHLEKSGALTSTFNAIPDAPFSKFELTLPEGPYSVLTANGANLCKFGSLTMPTELVAQDGAVIKQSTKVKITGCPRKKVVKHKAKKGKRKKGKNKKMQRK